MPKQPTLIARYRRLTFWNKIAFWGSIASLIGLPIGLLGLALTALGAEGMASLASAITQPLPITLMAVLIVFPVVLGYRRRRLDNLIAGLSQVPEDQRTTLIRTEYNRVVPDTISAQEWRKSNRERYMFLGLVGLQLLALVVVALLVWRSTKTIDAERLRQESEDKNRVETERLRIENNNRGSELDSIRSQLDQTLEKLNINADRDRRRLIIAAEASGHAAAIAHFQPSQETLELASKLKELVKEFESTTECRKYRKRTTCESAWPRPK